MKYYIVELGSGDMYEMGYSCLFVTDMEYKAKWYCSKANEIIQKYRDYYENKCFKEDVEADLFNHYYQRFMLASGVFVYTETETRTEFINLK